MGLKGGLPTMKSMFRSTFDDNQVGIFRGRRRPNEPENIEEQWDFIENWDSIDGALWTQDGTGTGHGNSISNGILTMTSGTDLYGWTSVELATNWGKIQAKGNFLVEIRMRHNRTATGAMETYIGFTDEPTQNYAINASDFAFVGYNWSDFGTDTMWVSTREGGAASTAIFGAYTNNVWETWRFEVKLGTGSKANEIQNSSGTTPDNIDLYFIVQMGNTTAATQTLEIDYIKIKYI